MELEDAARADLALEACSKSFEDVVAVDDVSLEVPRGTFYSLLGPSGCGKTTTLRLIAGFERLDSGRITLQGRDIAGDPPNRRPVNTVFQHYALFPHMRVEDNVAYGLKYERLSKDESAQRLEQVLATVRLAELRHRYPRELSGGQQQRVALARALVKQPRVLLLDEPLAALDLKLRRAMQVELKKLQERVGITFVYVTHDQEEALTLSDRIAVMNGGRVLQEGTPEDIYERPRSRFVADFIGETNLFEGTVEDAGDPVLVRDGSGVIHRCMASERPRAGVRVTVAVRPERIEPVGGAANYDNVIEAIVRRRTYLGDLLQLTLELDDQHELLMQRQNRSGDPTSTWEVGDRVRIGWSKESALVLIEDGGEVADAEARRLIEMGADV